MNISRCFQVIAASIILAAIITPISAKAIEFSEILARHPKPVVCMCNGKKVPARLCPFIHCADV